MFTKAEKNYFINGSLAVFGFICALTGLTLKDRAIWVSAPVLQIHEGTGYIASAIVLVHLVMHRKWLVAVTKNMFSSKRKVAILVCSFLVPIAVCAAFISFAPTRGDIPRDRFGNHGGYYNNFGDHPDRESNYNQFDSNDQVDSDSQGDL